MDADNCDSDKEHIVGCAQNVCGLIPGKFRPPLDGTYVFSVHGLSYGSGGSMDIKQNGNVICRTYVNNGNMFAASCTAVVKRANFLDLKTLANNKYL